MHRQLLAIFVLVFTAATAACDALNSDLVEKYEGHQFSYWIVQHKNDGGSVSYVTYTTALTASTSTSCSVMEMQFVSAPDTHNIQMCGIERAEGRAENAKEAKAVIEEHKKRFLELTEMKADLMALTSVREFLKNPDGYSPVAAMVKIEQIVGHQR